MALLGRAIPQIARFLRHLIVLFHTMSHIHFGNIVEINIALEPDDMI